MSVKPAEAIGWSGVANTELALIERCLAGDETANAALVFEHHRLVLGLATHLLGDREEALDVSQEVFLRVFRTLHRFRAQSSLRTWIFRIVVNQVRNRQRWWRRKARANQVSLDDHIREHGEMVLGADASTPDRELARKELGARLRCALQHLPFEQRTALVLREVEGLRYEEIAFSLKLPVGTVKSRLTRARQALREELGDLRC
ncbi:MAG TPA: sigma-70 family RNA polymerase sigma factor [Vicinamibacterales bacterium]|nr:sigma-70 family RNA polymerase sigma factor [Vicinamibacterales bacterium]